MSLLATHVGSLPRPQPVVDFLLARARSEAFDAWARLATPTEDARRAG